MNYEGTSTPDFESHYATFGGPTPDVDYNMSSRALPWTVPGSGAVVKTLERGMNSEPDQEGATVSIGLYDLADDSLIAEATIESLFNDTGYVWHSVAVDITLAAGMQVYIASGRPTLAIYHTRNLDNAEGAEPSTESLPATWVTTDSFRREIPLRLGWEVSDTPTLVSINDGAIALIGDGNTLKVANIEEVVSLTIAGIETTDLVQQSANEYTFTLPISEGNYPLFAPQIQDAYVYGSEGESAQLDVEILFPPEWDSVVITSISTDPDSIAQALDSAPPLAVGDTLYFESAKITIYDDSTFSGATAGTVVIWWRRADDNSLGKINVINGSVSPAGEAGFVEFVEKVSFIS